MCHLFEIFLTHKDNITHTRVAKMVLELTRQSYGFIGPCLNQPVEFIFVVVPHLVGNYPGFSSIKQLEVSTPPGMLTSPQQGFTREAL